MPDGYFLQCTLTFNPWSECWLKDKFFDRVEDNGISADGSIMAITTNYKCNEFLSDTDKKLFEDMKETDPQRYRVAGLGQWGISGGQFFDCWREDIHVVEPFDIPSSWVKFRCMDWGSARPYCCLWLAVDFDGDIWVYRELYGYGGKANVGTKETAQEVGEKIASMEKKKEAIAYAVLDNACWAVSGTTGPTIAEELNDPIMKKGLAIFDKCSKGRMEAANQIRQRLLGTKEKDGTRKPALKVFKTCKHLIRTLPMLTHDKHNPEVYDTAGEDHACLVAGTMVATDKGDVPIEDIKVGDMVLTINNKYYPVIASAMTKKNAKVMTLVLTNGKKITGTLDHHLYYVSDKFRPHRVLDKKPLRDFFVGDEMSNGSFVTAVLLDDETADVYNITVDKMHNYYANGVLSSNCDALAYGLMTRPYTPYRPQEKKEGGRYRKKRESKSRSAWTY